MYCEHLNSQEFKQKGQTRQKKNPRFYNQYPGLYPFFKKKNEENFTERTVKDKNLIKGVAISFLFVLFYNVIYLISNVVIGSGVQQRDSVIHIHISTLP